MEGNTARGASSPAKPALHMPDPLSTTRAAISSSIFCAQKWGREEEEDVYETGCSDSYVLHLANIKLEGRERPCRSRKRTLDVAVVQDGSAESGPRETKGGFCLGPWPWPYMAKVSAALVRKAMPGPRSRPVPRLQGRPLPSKKKRRGTQGMDMTKRTISLYSMECRFHIKAKKSSWCATDRKLRRDRHSPAQNIQRCVCILQTLFFFNNVQSNEVNQLCHRESASV